MKLSNLQDSAAVCVSELRSHLCFVSEIPSSCTQVLSLNILWIAVFSSGKTASFMSAALSSSFSSFHAAFERALSFLLCCPRTQWARWAQCSESPSAPNLQIYPHLSNGRKQTEFLWTKGKAKMMYNQNYTAVALQWENRGTTSIETISLMFSPQKIVSLAKEKRNGDRRKIILVALLLFLKQAHGKTSTFKKAWYNTKYLFFLIE